MSTDKKPKTATIKIKKEGKKRKEIITIRPKAEKKVYIELRRVNEVNKHLDNIRVLLLNSNATPIKCHAGIGYKCCFCAEQYPDAKDLKSHTIERHRDIIGNYLKGKSMLSYIVKLDITWLQCTLCGLNIRELEDLTEHLVKDHQKVYNNDIKSHIVPFRFDSEPLQCVICHNEFNNFKVLLEHMNIHFSNHVCEVCGCGFVNRRTLLAHGYRHVTGVFKCTYCPKVYDTKIKQKDHERAVHICLNKRNKCGYCGEKFTDYAKKKDHEVREHGAKPVVLKCQACGKTFDNQRVLTIHTKAYHMLERRSPKKKKGFSDM